jgi:choline-sulfatase
VLVVIDTLRADHVGGYGYARDTTPNLDALIAAGARFDTAIAQSSWSVPSHVSIATGALPSRHGVQRFDGTLPASVPTLATRLAQHGYATALFSSHYSLHGGVEGLQRGFETVVVQRHERDGPVLRAALEWMDGREAPFFVQLVLMTPHAPYTRYPEGWNDKLFTEMPPGGERTFPLGSARWVGRGAIPLSVALGGERRVGVYINRYDRAVRFGDVLLGRVVDALRRAGRLDDTLLVVTSDHGEGLGEHGVFAHEVVLYDFLVRVPLVFHFPGRIPAGQVFAEPVQLVDIVPTVLGLLGLESDADLDGVDLSAHLQHGTRPEGRRYAHASYALRGRQRYMVRSEAYKLIYDPLARREEFYDLGSDPGETHDLVAAGIPASLRREYAAHRAELQKLLDRQPARRLHGGPRVLPGDVKDELRALGYLEDAD